MKLKLFKFSIMFLFILQSAYAIPSFSRQMSESCQMCHFQHYALLNSFSRSFKSDGFVDIGEEAIIQKNGLSLPFVLNSSFVFKAKYQKTNGNDTVGTDVGIFHFPYEGYLFFGGRISKFIGFILETNVSALSISSFKMPFVYQLNEAFTFSIIPFLTNRLGASYGFELLNTGAVRNQIALEHSEDISAQQYIGISTPAQGISFVISHEIGFVNVGEWIPSSLFGISIKSPSHYLRGAITPKLGSFSLGIGFQIWRGDASYSAGGPFLTFRTRAFAIDGQMQGNIGKFPIGIYLTYAIADKSLSNQPVNIFNTNIDKDKTAFSILLVFGFLPNVTSISLGYRASQTGSLNNNQDNAFTLGLVYQIIPNLKFEIDFSKYSGSLYTNTSRNQLLSFLLCVGF